MHQVAWIASFELTNVGNEESPFIDPRDKLLHVSGDRAFS
jgi:hypothetical protein